VKEGIKMHTQSPGGQGDGGGWGGGGVKHAHWWQPRK
jgi:hypothetical protein